MDEINSLETELQRLWATEERTPEQAARLRTITARLPGLWAAERARRRIAADGEQGGVWLLRDERRAA